MNHQYIEQQNVFYWVGAQSKEYEFFDLFFKELVTMDVTLNGKTPLFDTHLHVGRKVEDSK